MKVMLMARLGVATVVLLTLAGTGAGLGVVMANLHAAAPAEARHDDPPPAQDGGGERAAPEGDATTPLDDAVRSFNRSAADLPGGKDQPPLRAEEVVAAIRWALLDRDKLAVSDDTCRALRAAADAGTLPPGFGLEVVGGYEPNDEVAFKVWSVRLRVPRVPDGTTCVTIREQMIGSRVIGAEERQVIQKWRAKEKAQGGVRSLQREEYRGERDEAAAKDMAKPRGPKP